MYCAALHHHGRLGRVLYCLCRYELCNTYGLYVVDEANLETHGFDPTFQDNAMNPACRWGEGREGPDARSQGLAPCRMPWSRTCFMQQHLVPMPERKIKLPRAFIT